MYIALILIFIAFVSLGLHFAKRDTGIKIHDQVIPRETKTSRAESQKYYTIGLLIGLSLGFVLTGKIFLTLLAGVLGMFVIGERLFKRKQAKTKYLLNEQFTQVLNSIISSLESGSNPYQAFEEVVLTLKNPARDIFIEILRKNRTGTNYYQAIGIVAEESGWEDLKQIEVAFRLYDKTGSDLVEVFNYLLQAAYDKKADRKYLEGLTSQIRMTGIVLSAIPFFLLGAMRFMAPEFAYPLLNEPTGNIIIILVVIMVFAGNKIINKMVENIS